MKFNVRFYYEMLDFTYVKSMSKFGVVKRYYIVKLIIYLSIQDRQPRKLEILVVKLV